MNKFILSIVVCLTVTACGQKGPLIVDRPVSQAGSEIDGELSNGTNETETRLNRQVEGQPTIIYR